MECLPKALIVKITRELYDQEDDVTIIEPHSVQYDTYMHEVIIKGSIYPLGDEENYYNITLLTKRDDLMGVITDVKIYSSGNFQELHSVYVQERDVLYDIVDYIFEVFEARENQ